MKPFQGWRYLSADDAPLDDVTGAVSRDELPAALRRELAALAFI
jgi:hypothetical protein